MNKGQYEYIQSQINEINDKIKKATKEINLLKEYRQALIFEAVTGKIDVRQKVGPI